MSQSGGFKPAASNFQASVKSTGIYLFIKVSSVKSAPDNEWNDDASRSQVSTEITSAYVPFVSAAPKKLGNIAMFEAQKIEEPLVQKHIEKKTTAINSKPAAAAYKAPEPLKVQRHNSNEDAGQDDWDTEEVSKPEPKQEYKVPIQQYQAPVRAVVAEVPLQKKSTIKGNSLTAIAMYDYTAEEPNELSITTGEFLTSIVKVSDDWWEGKNQHGDTGVFPANYVALQTGNIQITNANNGSTNYGQAPVQQQYQAPLAEAPLQKKGTIKGNSLTAIVLYDYTADEANELSIYTGETLTAIVKISDDWWEGENQHGQTGIFPANYVELNTGNNNDKSNHQLVPKILLTPNDDNRSDIVAISLYDYTPGEAGEIELKDGETISGIVKVSDDWWKGNNSRGKSGLFPANYVEIRASLSNNNNSSESKYEKESRAINEEARISRENIARNSRTQALGKCAISLYDYTPSEDNEIGFGENERITDIEEIDTDWWSGTNQSGHVGLFPANYVKIEGSIDQKNSVSKSAGMPHAVALYDYDATEVCFLLKLVE